ncbi:MAG TPA: dodecin domain-containing protein, partial [Albitalea sp.]|nr:dodecin domain-containing protein [Albitalea sp.]
MAAPSQRREKRGPFRVESPSGASGVPLWFAAKGASVGAARPTGAPMSSHVYKMLELTGSSAISIEEAVQNAVTK